MKQDFAIKTSKVKRALIWISGIAVVVTAIVFFGGLTYRAAQQGGDIICSDFGNLCFDRLCLRVSLLILLSITLLWLLCLAVCQGVGEEIERRHCQNDCTALWGLLFVLTLLLMLIFCSRLPPPAGITMRVSASRVLPSPGPQGNDLAGTVISTVMHGH
jgi:hypothetical protein